MFRHPSKPSDNEGVSDSIELLLPLLVPFAALLGLIVGSFLNVVIYRVPADLSVVSPRSACPKCETPIRGRDNIPVLSWLLLRGKCRDCSEPISARYPAIEIITSALFAGVAWWSLEQVPALTPLFLYLTAIGVALFMIDLDCKRLPWKIVWPSQPVVLALLVLAGFLSGQWPWSTVLISTVVWFFVFAIPWFVTAGRGMGFGDVMLAPILGASLGALGWGPSLVGLLSGFAFGTVVGVGMMIFASAGRKTAVPYGPFMLAGALFGMLCGQPVWEWYLTTMGLA